MMNGVECDECSNTCFGSEHLRPQKLWGGAVADGMPEELGQIDGLWRGAYIDRACPLGLVVTTVGQWVTKWVSRHVIGTPGFTCRSVVVYLELCC